MRIKKHYWGPWVEGVRCCLRTGCDMEWIFRNPEPRNECYGLGDD